MFDDLNFVIVVLRDYLLEFSLKFLGVNDVVYGGDYVKWFCFVNFLKFCLVFCIVNVDEVLVCKMVEEVVSDVGGLIDFFEYNVMVVVGVEFNLFWLVVNSWGEIRVNVILISYMNGYNDLCMVVYFILVIIDGEVMFVGFCLGVKGMISVIGVFFLKFNFFQGESMLMFFSLEIVFLCVEGVLRGWNMGGMVQEFYE